MRLVALLFAFGVVLGVLVATVRIGSGPGGVLSADPNAGWRTVAVRVLRAEAQEAEQRTVRSLWGRASAVQKLVASCRDARQLQPPTTDQGRSDASAVTSSCARRGIGF